MTTTAARPDTAEFLPKSPQKLEKLCAIPQSEWLQTPKAQNHQVKLQLKYLRVN